MKDVTTGEPLKIMTDGITGPYMFIPVNQLEKVTALLNENRIEHWVEDDVISIDGAPEDAVINFGRESDPATIQRILDLAL